MAHATPVQHIEAILVPALADVGYELVQASFADAGRTLRLVIDHLDPAAVAAAAQAADADKAAEDAAHGKSQGGVSLEDCARASKVADAALDAEGGPHAANHDNLEVSSPGIERPLVKPGHFQRFVGQPVKLQLRPGAVEGKTRRLLACLAAADDTAIQLTYDAPHHAAQPQRPAQLTYAQIDRANLVYEAASPITDQHSRGPKARARAKE